MDAAHDRLDAKRQGGQGSTGGRHRENLENETRSQVRS